MRSIEKRQQAGATLLPVLASASASVITGTALVATRFVVSGSDGLTIATLRYVIAACCLLPLVPLFDRMNVTLRDLLPIAFLGLLYFGLFPWCISAAMKFTTASGGSIVLACTPAATLLLGNLTGREEWSIRKALGVIFAIIGAGAAIGHIGFDFTAAAWRGDLAMIAATLLGAIYAIFSKPYLKKYSPLVVTAIAMAAGAIGLLVFWTAIDLPQGLPHLDPKGWLWIFYIGIAGGALSFFLYAWALGQTAPTTTMILLPLNPIAAIITGSLFLGEPLYSELFLGLALVIIGIILVVGVNGNGAGRLSPMRNDAGHSA
jgi:drug/metabolite transporter (DMT)-like permease